MQSSLTWTQILGLISFAASMATGQILFKYGATQAGIVQGLQGWIDLLLKPVIVLALTLYAFSTILWLWLLQKIPLTIAYPFAALAFLLVPIGAWIFFREPLNLRYLLGVCLILAGVIVTTTSRA
jgi:multidrug transporter EmrE-like cation transporter